MRFDLEKLKALILPNVNYLILLVYTILSIIFTYPVAFSINKIPGGGDAWWFLWDFWSFKKAVLNLSNPYYTTDIFYPTGVSLAFSDISPFNTIISIPLQYLFGLIATYNMIWILTFILSGFGTYLLVKYLTNNRKAAFIFGLIFMFCPYRFAHALGHMNLTATEWIPFYVLFLIKMTIENKKANALYAAFFLVLTAMTSNYYLVYMFSFTLLYITYYRLVDKSLINKDFIKRFLVMLISFVVGFSPFLYILLKELLFSGSNYIYAGGFEEFSADLMGFFTPTIFHPIFKDLVSPINSHFSGGGAEFTVFAGYTVLFLSIIAIVKIKTKEIKFWTLSAITFFILCLGPILNVIGVTNFSLGGHYFNIPLPYQILMHIPVFSMVRVPSRWDVLVMLSLAILAGYGLNYIFNIIKSRSPGKSGKESRIFIIISCLILFEFLAVPFPMSSAEIPAIYKQMEVETDDYGILEVPGTGAPNYMYFQTLHGKKLVNGYVSRTPSYAIEFTSHTPLIADLIPLSEPGDLGILRYSPLGYTDIFSRQEEANIWNRTELMSILCYYNIRYIIIHKGYFSDKEFSFASNLIHDTLGIEPIAYDSGIVDSKIGFQCALGVEPVAYVSDGVWVYRIPTSQNSSSLIPLGSGFHDLGDWSGTPTRWIQANGTLPINSPENCTANLSLNAHSFYHPRTWVMPLGSGFHDLEDWSGTPTRWIQANGTLLINSPENRTANLSLNAHSFYHPRTLEVFSGGALEAQVVVPTSFFNVTVPVHLAKGVNIVRFHVLEGCERPSDLQELNNSDSRCLSVAVQNVTIS